jgi:polynucleotide 5'-kinase involved in rRNA processing
MEREISTTWRETPHLAVAGMTQNGKSSFLRLIAATCIMNGDKLLVANAVCILQHRVKKAK